MFYIKISVCGIELSGYLNNESDLTLEPDLRVNVGLSEKNLTEFFTLFKDSVNFFEDLLLSVIRQKMI